MRLPTPGLLVALTTATLAAVSLAQSQPACANYGQSSGASCVCPAGFDPTGSSSTCALPQCGGSLYSPAAVAQGSFGNTSDCACTDGWTGPACTVCKTGDACTASIQNFLNSSTALANNALNTSMTCSAVPTVYAAGHMSCAVNVQLLQTLFPGKSQLSISRFLNASRTPGGTDVLSKAGIASGDGVVWAQLWYDGVEQFYCTASGCTQTVSAGGSSGSSANSSEWTCPTLNCTCRPGTSFCGGGTSSTQNLTAAIDPLAGPLTVGCSADGTCNFKQIFLTNLFGDNGLALEDCVFGECVQQYVVDQAEGVSEDVSGASGNHLSGGVIAGLAVVGAAILGIILFAIWGVIARNKARKAPLEPHDKDDTGVGLAWSGVGYEVEPRGRGWWGTTVRWLRGWDSGKPSRPSTPGGSEDGNGVGPNGGKVVLRDVCGELPPGGFCAVLGPSGAGKSTLVDILAGMRKTGVVQGKVAYIDPSHAHRDRRVKIGYVDQSDVLSPTSTVLEVLQFAAEVRIPENVPRAVKEERAREVLQQLGLADVASTRIGSGEHRGISGGEMRRVSIGVELVAAPDILILDEPTSGLDSVSAARIVSLLKSLTKGGDGRRRTTIVASIHQPSSALYRSFDQVCVLARGRQLYFGPGGDVPAEFFARQGRPCPKAYNVADHLLEVAAESPEGLRSGTEAIVRGGGSSGSDIDAADHDVSKTTSDESVHRATTTDEKGHNVATTSGTDDDRHPVPALRRTFSTAREVDLAALAEAHRRETHEWWPRNHCATTFLTQFLALSGREWRNLKRDKTLFIAHVLVACILGCFAGGLYFDINLTIAGFQNLVGSLFFLGALVSFTSLSALNNVVEIRPLFLREREANFYSPQAWILSRIVFDLVPLRIIPSIIVSTIVYFMVGLDREPAQFFKFLLVILEYTIVATLYNYLLAVVFSHPSLATLMSALFILANLLYAGFFINLMQIPPVLRWVRYLMPLGYALEAMTINEVGTGLQIIDVLNGVPIQIGAVVIMHTLFGFELGNFYRNVVILAGFIGGVGILLVCGTLYLLRQSR